MRISTNQIFRTGIDSIQRTQQELSRTQLQLGSGKRILTPADDPSGAVQAQQFRSGIEKVAQYQRNSQLLTHRLRYNETILTSVTDGLQRVRELALQGNNATQNNETRGSIAGEIRQILDELYQLANTRDSNGEYLFAGTDSLTPAFAIGPGGEALYQGDDGQRALRISAVRQVPVGDSGERVFMSIPNGNGTFFVRDDPGNTGSGVIGPGAVTDPAAWVPDEYTIDFATNSDGELVYRIAGVDSGPVLPLSGDVDDAPLYTSGETIAFNGVQVSIEGAPVAGDSFTLAPSENRDLFATYRQLSEALEAPVSSDAGRARLNNAVNRALEDLDRGLGRLLEVRASLGARLNTVENQNRINEDQLLQLRTALSGIEDLDYAEAINRFNIQQTVLQAAQQTYVQVQRLSLFNYF